MKLPTWALDLTCEVLDRVEGTLNGLNERTGETWQPRPGVPCASYPVSEKNLEQAGLLGIAVTREVYLSGVNLDTQKNRLRIDGTDYSVEDSREWDGFTVALVREVP